MTTSPIVSISSNWTSETEARIVVCAVRQNRNIDRGGNEARSCGSSALIRSTT